MIEIKQAQAQTRYIDITYERRLIFIESSTLEGVKDPSRSVLLMRVGLQHALRFTSRGISRGLQSPPGSVPDRCSIVSGKYRGIDRSLGE